MFNRKEIFKFKSDNKNVNFKFFNFEFFQISFVSEVDLIDLVLLILENDL